MHADADAGDRIDGPLARLIGVMVLGGFMALLDATIVNVGIGTLRNFVVTFALSDHAVYLKPAAKYDDGRYRGGAGT